MPVQWPPMKSPAAPCLLTGAWAWRSRASHHRTPAETTRSHRRFRIEGEWIDRPKPTVARPNFGQGSPRDRIAGDGRGYSEYTRLMFDLIALAFQTDSTRAVSH